MMNERQQWIIEGEFARSLRLSLGLSINEMATMMGVAWSTVKRFEDGQKVRRRRFLVTAYHLALDSEDQRREIIRLQGELQYFLSRQAS